MREPPIILLAFANDKLPDGQYLDHLANEEDRIVDSLEKAIGAGICQVVSIHNATIRKIKNAFRKHGSRIAIFHFAGHGGNDELLMKTPFGALQELKLSKFAAFLALQKGVQLVFLNACATLPQAIILHKHQVPLVIATSRSIEDKKASLFAIEFYDALATGRSIKTAFQETISIYQTGEETNLVVLDKDRGIGRRKRLKSYEVAWILSKSSDDQRAETWNLPDAVNHPLYRLPLQNRVERKGYFLPGTNPYTRDHTEAFYGRDSEIWRLYQLLDQSNGAEVIVLYGGTGVGKSSLLRAGLTPRLPQDWVLLTSYSNDHNLCKRINSMTSISPCEHFQLIIIDQFSTDSIPLTSSIARLLDSTKALIKIIVSIRIHDLDRWIGALRRKKIDYSLFYLAPLSSGHICEIFEGLSREGHLKLALKDNLPQLISQMLSRDKHSPIAPLLQYLLVAMGEAAEEITHSSPEISRTLYHQLEWQGLWEKFITDVLQNVDEEAYQSGLLLNILFGILESMDVENRGWDLLALEEDYSHISSIRSIVDGLIEGRILTEVVQDRKVDRLYIRLSHDILRIPLLKILNRSEQSGIVARRILYHHEKQDTLPVYTEAIFLENQKSYMSHWTVTQEARVRDSIIAGKRNHRSRQLKKIKYCLIIFTLFLLSLLNANFFFSAFIILLMMIYEVR